MKKAVKLSLGIATLVPLFYFTLLFLTPLGKVFSTDPLSPEAPPWLLYFTAFHFFMYLYTGFLLAFYVINLFGKNGMERDRKILWAIALILVNVFAMPVYWYFHFWKED